MLYATLKEWDAFVTITHACVLTNTLVGCNSDLWILQEFFILVEALPKLMLYGKYGTQRVVSRRNIAVVILYLSLTHSFMCLIFRIALTSMLYNLYIK